MLSIDYDHDYFPPRMLASADRRLTTSWGDVLWAALTVGRPDLYHVFRFGNPSLHEAIFRLSMVRMALEQRNWRGRLWRTDAFKHMDPTERGAINYFLGLVFCKLFASEKLGAPWCLHLDVWRHTLNPTLLAGRSRPDLVAQNAVSGAWYAFESKGRASVPRNNEKVRAKAQASRLVRVGRRSCRLHVGAISYYSGDVLRFYWRDPEADGRNEVKIPEPKNEWRMYYAPFAALYRANAGNLKSPSPNASVVVRELDVNLRIHPAIWELIAAERWVEARAMASELREQFENAGYHPDGLGVSAGKSWHVERRTRRKL